MLRALIRLRWWLFSCLALCLLGCFVLGRFAYDRQREAFDTDARIMHRALSQRLSQHDAILATISLLQAEQGAERERRLASLYPQILATQRRESDQQWSDPRYARAETISREFKRPVMAAADFTRGRYVLLLAGEPASHAMTIGMREMLPWDEWPVDPRTGTTQVLLQFDNQTLSLQSGRTERYGWHFEVSKRLATESQPFDLHVSRAMPWYALPWAYMLAWCALVVVACLALYQLRAQRVERQRAEELLRVGQVARLNTLGELAAGLAHELNQPLTAVLANTHAARRMIEDSPADIDMARAAMAKAAEQAHRAADVVGRLRRVVERPEAGSHSNALDLVAAARRVLHLLEPECRQRGVLFALEGEAHCTVMAEPVGLEQIIHNLVMNALQALEHVAPGERALHMRVFSEGGKGILRIADSGPGIPPDVLPRVFEPFFSTRDGGLGLGLSLCETLAAGMGGELRAANGDPRGAVFLLGLPLANHSPHPPRHST